MRKIHDMLRLHFELKLPHRQIARSLQLSQSTVSEYLVRFQQSGLAWPLPDGYDDQRLQEELLGCVRPGPVSARRPRPDLAHVQHELTANRHTTLQLLWEGCRDAHPGDHYSYTSLWRHFEEWRGRQDLAMRQQHRAGEKLFVDWAGAKIPIHDPATGEVKLAQQLSDVGIDDRHWAHYGAKKRSAGREKRVLEGVRSELGNLFVREVDGEAVGRWYGGLTAVRDLSPGTAIRHFNVMHHIVEKASTIWSKETGIDRNPADQVEVKRPDDQRDRYLSADELRNLKQALDDKTFRKSTTALNRTFYRLRLLVLIAPTTGMQIAEVFGLRWSDVMYDEGLLAVRAKLKGGKMRYVPMTPELAGELRRVPAVIGEGRILPPNPGEKGVRQRVEGSFDDLFERAGIEDFRFHDLRHTFASRYMMNGGDLYELAKILGHSNIKMTERYAQPAKQHIAKTGSTAREIWKLSEQENCGKANVG